MNILKSIRSNFSNSVGKTIKEKVLIIESDDWGSVRSTSIDAFKRLEKSGLDLRSADAERYNLNDSLATSNDLESLFEVLYSIKDKNNNNAVFTPVCIVANPDFQKISDSGFKEYFYEPFNETLKRYPGCEHSFELWKEGIDKRIFVPQMHGREHLNVAAWMNALQNGDKDTNFAFKEGMWGFVPSSYPKIDYQAAFLLSNINEIDYHKRVISEGLLLFNNLFGYKAEYFVAPNGPFNNSLNKILVENGVKFRCTSKMQMEPLGSGKYRKVIHYLGQKDKYGIRYITRNCFFEPSQKGKDWVNSCLNDINIAFKWNKPAIISSHRVNYIGSLNPDNRERGLSKLSELLKEIIRLWPDIKFMTTPQLGNLLI